MSDKFNQFKLDLRSYWIGDGRDLQVGADLLRYLRNPLAKITESEFKWYLADAIINKRFSIEEYEKLTDLDFETRDEVAADLTQLWETMFEGEPVALPQR